MINMDNPTLRLAGIEEESIVDGPGIRLTIFTQGCTRKCKGCHNPKTHPLDKGEFYSINQILDLYKKNPLYQGITFSGGEPFIHRQILIYLAKEIKKLKGDIVCYTGYTYEELLDWADIANDYTILDLLSLIDILIDGEFIEEQKSLELKFRGSENQRILYLKENSYRLK